MKAGEMMPMVTMLKKFEYSKLLCLKFASFMPTVESLVCCYEISLAILSTQVRLKWWGKSLPAEGRSSGLENPIRCKTK